jgi:hypothetical protein
MDDFADRTIEEEISDVRMTRPHVVLLGAGASRAALPHGDKSGRTVPLMREVADELSLADLFPDDLKALAATDFEAAYSELVDQGHAVVDELNELIREYFSRLRLPDEPNLYDYLLLSLRGKDAVFTFNWDPLLVQSHVRLQQEGLLPAQLPQLFFLHRNVAIGFCVRDRIMGIAGDAGIRGYSCSRCGEAFTPSQLLFPVAKKNYNEDPLIAEQWTAAQYYLKNCFMFTIFGYSAPKTDVEAVDLMKRAWGEVEERALEQTEIINRPGCDYEVLRATWDPFIHTHHYDIFESFFDSWLAQHPRRTGEAYISQYLEARFIENNPIPQDFDSIVDLVRWFGPLLAAEQ